MHTALSVNGVTIRLTEERWFHIVENHDELSGYFFEVLDAIERPDFIIRANNAALKAIRTLGKRKTIAVLYREISPTDGFVITSYFLEKPPKGEILWRQN